MSTSSSVVLRHILTTWNLEEVSSGKRQVQAWNSTGGSASHAEQLVAIWCLGGFPTGALLRE
jgi:hypothetical protein